MAFSEAAAQAGEVKALVIHRDNPLLNGTGDATYTIEYSTGYDPAGTWLPDTAETHMYSESIRRTSPTWNLVPSVAEKVVVVELEESRPVVHASDSTPRCARGFRRSRRPPPSS